MYILILSLFPSHHSVCILKAFLILVQIASVFLYHHSLSISVSSHFPFISSAVCSISTSLSQEQESTKERLISAGADYERQEEKYNCEIERLQEKLNKVTNMVNIVQ